MINKKKTIIVFIIITMALLMLIVLKQKTIKKPQNIVFFSLDTSVGITVYDNNENTNQLLNMAKEKVYEFENILSKTKIKSDIYNINNNNKEDYIEISLDTAFLFELSKDFFYLSNEKFDISIGRLVDYWSLVRENKTKPEKNDIYKLINTTKNMNYEIYYNDGEMKPFDILYNDRIIGKDISYYIENIDTIKNNENYKYYIKAKNNNQTYDLGAIAKGYIADYIKYYLKKNNIKSAIINLGGNVLCIGNKYGKDFVVGIKKPFYENEIINTIYVSDESVVTSGIYERYVQYDNDDIIYHHIIDNNTGYPTNNDLVSATVVTDLSIFGDVISTICILNGKDGINEMIKTIENKYAIKTSINFVDSTSYEINK